MRKKFALFLLLLITTAFLIVGGRCFYLQFYKVKYYLQASERAQKSNLLEKSRRGAILDCRGRILAASYKVNTIFAEPRAIENLKQTSQDLSEIIGLSPSQISQVILTSRNQGYAPLLVDTELKLSNSQRKKLRQLRGIGIEGNWKRFYTLGRDAAHVIGFVGRDGKGLAGLELKYNKQLSGSVGKSSFFADSARRPVSLGQCESFAQDGADIILTIDSTIQKFTHSALLKQYKEFQAESAIAMVTDPCSGAILSMVSLPDFDPANLKTADANSLGNHILSDPYEPGSIFKPIVAAWAIETGSIDRNETIFCENGNYRGKGFGSIGEYRHGYGDLKISEILARSSNIGMAKIGQKMGAEKIYEGIKFFGFGRKTGIDLLGEECGLVWKPEKWTGYSIARVPFGHEVSVTALQMAYSYCILANNGRVTKPHLVKAIVFDAGKKLKITAPTQTGGYILKEDTAKWMVTKALVDVVNEGTGKKAALKKWQVWGKTGTANIASKKGGYDEKNYVASFIGGAPAENPAVVVLVSIRKPKRKLGKGYTGGSVAAPAAAEILEKTLNYLDEPVTVSD